MSETTIVLGSKEYLYVDLTADQSLVDQTVEVAITTGVADAVWQPAEWQGQAGLSRSARILLDGTLAAGRYNVFVRLTDLPEVPILNAGKLRVTAQ